MNSGDYGNFISVKRFIHHGIGAGLIINDNFGF
jgi:hypothetical protein